MGGGALDPSEEEVDELGLEGICSLLCGGGKPGGGSRLCSVTVAYRRVGGRRGATYGFD
jgi:hypothetical protein